MIAGDVVLNAFIDANILLIVAFALWHLARFVLRQLGVKHAYATELKLLNGGFLAIVFAPFVILILSMLKGTSLFAVLQNLNISDRVVAHFLSGGIEMKASEFERILLTRDSFIQNLVGTSGWVAQLVIATFVFGFVLGAGRLIQSVISLRKIVAQSYAWRRSGRVHLRLSDTTSVPFSTRGLWNFYVVIPTEMLGSRDELKVSIAHEFQHLRQGDLNWEVLLEALKPVFFLNPAYHAWKRKVEELRELSCDHAVLARGRISMRIYCDTLVSVCQKTLQRDRMFKLALPKVALVSADRAMFGQIRRSLLEARVISLLDARAPRYPRLVLAVVLIPLASLLILMAIAMQSPGDWSQDRLMLSTVVNLERLDEINRMSAFGRPRN